jgi:hypothetical protein
MIVNKVGDEIWARFERFGSNRRLFFKKYEYATCTNVVTVTEAPRPERLESAVNWSTLPFKARVQMI